MAKKNILITCAGGSASVFFAKSLRDKFNIFLVDSSVDNIAPYLGFPFRRIPFGTDKNFLKEVDAIVRRWHINCIVPGADEELLPINLYHEKNPDVLAVIPSIQFIRLCLNKKKLTQALRKFDISHIPMFETISAVRYPAIIKPIVGRGSREVHIVRSASGVHGYLKLYKKNISQVVIQKFIEGEEYTVSVIVNNLNKIIGIVPKKIILKRGITRAAVVERNELIARVCEKIVAVLNPAGPFNVQLKLFKNKVYIFEINPRLSTTAVLTDRAFGNEIELYIKYYDKAVIDHPPKLKNKIALYRYEENIFVK